MAATVRYTWMFRTAAVVFLVFGLIWLWRFGFTDFHPEQRPYGLALGALALLVGVFLFRLKRLAIGASAVAIALVGISAAVFAPNLIVALALLLARAALSQMDVPTRTSYVMAVVTPAERTAAASVTAVPRSLASSISPALTGALLATPAAGLPFIACGVLKIIYDLALLYSFRHVKPPEEQT